MIQLTTEQAEVVRAALEDAIAARTSARGVASLCGDEPAARRHLRAMDRYAVVEDVLRREMDGNN